MAEKRDEKMDNATGRGKERKRKGRAQRKCIKRRKAVQESNAKYSKGHGCVSKKHATFLKLILCFKKLIIGINTSCMHVCMKITVKIIQSCRLFDCDDQHSQCSDSAGHIQYTLVTQVQHIVCLCDLLSPF